MQEHDQAAEQETPRPEDLGDRVNPARAPADAPVESAIEAVEAVDLLRRERADFRNYKRRVEQERAESRTRTTADVLTQLLPLLDALDRALDEVPAELESHPWVRGVQMSRHQLSEVLNALGIQRFGAPGDPFDPRWHEALTFEAMSDRDQRCISAVVRPGYRLGDRLIRPAEVTVTGGRSTDGSAADHPSGEAPVDTTEPDDD